MLSDTSDVEEVVEQQQKAYTTRAQDRLVDYEVDFSKYKAFGVYRYLPHTKRNTGKAPISWIFGHGVEVEELQQDGPGYAGTARIAASSSALLIARARLLQSIT